MEQPQEQASRHVRTEDLLAPPPIGRALALAGLAAVAGAAIWGLLRIYGNLEHGVVAWGIGGLIGFAIIKAGGHGVVLSTAGAVLAVLSIAAGKQISFQSMQNEIIESSMEQVALSYDETRTDAEAWAKLGDSPSDEAVEEFALDHNFDVDNAAQLRSEFGPDLDRFAAEQPSREVWTESKRTIVEESIAENFTFMDYLREDFNLFDILFIGLGIATAFGMVHKHTLALQVEARQNMRGDPQDEPEDKENE
tara:strand:+ start:1030 stop:1782 length:753 start_codon:yes stop_codon:yes gene_type:complete